MRQHIQVDHGISDIKISSANPSRQSISPSRHPAPLSSPVVQVIPAGNPSTSFPQTMDCLSYETYAHLASSPLLGPGYDTTSKSSKQSVPFTPPSCHDANIPSPLFTLPSCQDVSGPSPLLTTPSLHDASTLSPLFTPQSSGTPEPADKFSSPLSLVSSPPRIYISDQYSPSPPSDHELNPLH
jgi:hypothetical protein